MRNFLLIYLTYLLSGYLISQNLNIAEHEGIDKTGEMVAIGSRIFYFGGDGNTCCGYNLYLKGKDKNDSTLFKNGFPVGNAGAMYFGNLISTSDNSLFLNYWTVKSCDIFQHTDYIAKVDTNGTMLFCVPIQSLSVSGFSATITGITQHPDSTYYLSSSSDLYHYSTTGQFISKITTPLTGIVSIKALSNGRLFVHGNLNGNKTNVIMLTNGAILKQVITSNTIKKTVEIGNHYFSVYSGGTIGKIDTMLNQVSSFNAGNQPLNTDVCNFTTRNDTLFVVGVSNPRNTLYYTLLDTAFTQLYLDTVSYKGIVPTGVAITSKNKVAVISTCNSKSTPRYSFSGYFQFPLNGGFKSKSDVGVVGFSNVNTWLNLNQGSTIFPTISMDVTVKNFGQDTVNSFFINYYANFFMCPSLLHKKCISSLAPGQTVTLSTGNFYGQTFYETPPVTQKYIDICVFTSIPNQSNDINIDNDAFCDSILFTATAIRENEQSTYQIEAFPNPFNESLIVRADVEIRTVSLYNALGQKLSELVIKAKEWQLNLINLPSGMYFLNVETEKGVLSKKLLKY